MLTIYSADGAQKYPLDVPGATFYITHVYGGLDTLTFNISPNHKLYPLISEEITVEYDDILYKVKNINERETVCTVSCTIDLDCMKVNAYKVYRSETRTLRDVLQEQLPGWTLDGVDLVSSRRTIEPEKCNGYDVVMQAAKTYNIAYEWHNKEKRVRILKPENVQPSGEYITDELNLRKLTFKGSSKSFATRIYPYGKDSLSIAEVNGGLPYLDNHTYSNQVISTVWVDERYTDPISLRDDAIERLKGLAVPVRSYECDVVDLAKVNNYYSDLSMKLYGIVTLIDRRRGTRIDHRIVEYKEYPYNPEKNVVTLSSVAEKITTKIDKIEVKFNDEIKVDRQKVNEIRRDVDTNSARIAETYNKGETDTRIESLVQQSADSITTTVRKEISTAVDDVQVGGRNLLLKSDVPVTTTDYIMHDYYFGAEKPVAGETYTISIKGSLHKDKLYFGVFNSGDVIGVCYPTTPDADGVYRKTFPWIDKIDNAVAGNTFIRIYAMPSRITGAESTIEWIKLEKGNKATDWTQAPEDVDSKIDAVQTRVTTAETQITQNAEAISQRATKTEVQTVKASADAANNKIDGLQVGGRNLLLDSNRLVSNNDYLVAEYTPAELLVAGQQYTVSIDIDPAAGARYNVFLSGGYAHQCTLEPPAADRTVVSKTFTARYDSSHLPETNPAYGRLQIYRAPNDGTVTEKTTIYKIKLEKGNKSTDWSPAPEDQDDALNQAITKVETQQSEILQKSNEIMLQALSSYITKTRLEEFEKEVSARLAVQSDNITASFNQANTYTVEVDGRLQEFLEEFATYIRMSASGIELGDSNSPFGALLGTTKLSFTQDGREIAYISNNRLYITDAEISNSLTVGSSIKYKTYIDSNGYLVTQKG